MGLAQVVVGIKRNRQTGDKSVETKQPVLLMVSYPWLLGLALTPPSRDGLPLHTYRELPAGPAVADSRAHSSKGPRGPCVTRHHAPSRGSSLSAPANFSQSWFVGMRCQIFGMTGKS